MFLVLYLYGLSLLWSVDCQSGNTVTISKPPGPDLDLSNTLNKRLTQCLDDLSAELKKREPLTKQLKEKAEKIWLKNKPQTLKTKVLVNGNVHVQKRLRAHEVIISKPDNDRIGQIKELEKRLDISVQNADRIEYQIENEVVRMDKTDQVISGNIHFLNPIVAENITIKSLKTSTLINGISLDDLENNVLRKSGHQTVTGRWNFTTLYVKTLTVNGLLSGINMSNILLTNSPQEQVVTGRLKIGRGTFKSLSFNSINGINKDELVFKAHHPPAKITAPKRFTNVLSATNIDLMGNLNGHNWTHLVRHSININKPNGSVSSKLHFTTPPEIGDLKVRSLNKMRIDNLKSAITPKELVQLSGFKTFRSLSVGKVILHGKLNGLSIPSDLVTLNSLQNLSAPITFEGQVNFTSDLNVGTINGIDLTRDVVFRHSNSPQVITGDKVFDNSVKVRNLNSKVNQFRHINLDSLNPLAPDGGQFVRRSNVVYEDQLTIDGSLTVRTINGININQLVDSLFSRSRDQTIFWPIRFNGSLSVAEATTINVNGFRVPDDLVLTNTNGAEQVIRGRKVIKSITLGAGNELVMKGQTLNGQDFDSLDRTIIKNDASMQRDCYGQKNFTSVKVSGNIVAESVNGLNLERDVLLVNRPQTIPGKLVFGTDVRVDRLSFPSGLKVGKINGLSVDETLDRLVLQDSSSITLENKDFRGALLAEEIDLLGTVNGVNLVALASNVVNLNSPQAVSSPLRFEDEITFDNPIDTRSINGHDLQKRFTGIFDSDSSSSPTSLKIIGNVKVNGDLITGRLNNLPTDQLKNFIIHPKKDNSFDRPVIFNSTITINHLSISKEATLDGIFPGDLLPLDQPIQLDKPMRIRGNAFIDNKLIVRSGMVNNCSLNSMTLTTNLRNTSQVLIVQRPINVNSLNILGNLRLINSTINGNNINYLEYLSQIGLPRNQSFNSSFTFEGDVYVDELFVSGSVNGVDLQSINFDSVKISAGPQNITGNKEIKSFRIYDGDITFSGDVQLRGTINGINITQMNDDLIKPGQSNEINGVKIFSSTQPPVFTTITTPTISGVNTSNMVSTRSSETITTETTFNQPTEVGDLTTRSLHGRQVDPRQNVVKFMSPVYVQQLIVKRVNNIPVENFVSTLRDTQLNGSYTIDKVYIHGNLIMDPNTTINGVDLAKLNVQSVDTRSPQSISGTFVLNSTLNLKQGIDFPNGGLESNRYTKSLGNTTDSLEYELRQLEDELKDQSRQVDILAASIEPDKLKFLYFDEIDYFNDFGIDTSPIEKISISKDYRSTNASSTKRTTAKMYLQYADKVNRCWRKTSIFEIHATNENSPLKDKVTNNGGKSFPLATFLLPGGKSINVSAWTNLPDCGQANIDEVLSKVFINSLEINFPEHEAFSDINYFLGANDIILITLRSANIKQSSIKVYRCPLNGKHCNVSQTITKHNFVTMDMIHCQRLNVTLLGAITKPANCTHNSTIFIYQWNSQNGKFVESGSLETPIPLEIKLIEWKRSINLIVTNNLETGLCANEKQRQSLSAHVNILRIWAPENNSIQPSQSIELNANAVSSFIVDNQIYLVLTIKSQDKIVIYQLDKNDTFVPIDQEYTLKGVEDVNCFWLSPDHLFMIATTSDSLKARLYRAFMVGITS